MVKEGVCSSMALEENETVLRKDKIVILANGAVTKIRMLMSNQVKDSGMLHSDRVMNGDLKDSKAECGGVLVIVMMVAMKGYVILI